MRGYHLVDEIEDFQGVAQTVVGDVVIGADVDAQEVRAWRPDGPERCAEVALSQAGDVDVTRSISRKFGKDRQWVAVWQSTVSRSVKCGEETCESSYPGSG